MKHYLLYFVFITLFISCDQNNNRGSQLLDFLPDNISIIINSNSFENLSTAIDHNLLLNETSNYNQLKTIKQKLQILNHLNIEDEFLIGLSNTDSLNYTFITKATEIWSKRDSIPNHTSKTFISKKNSITKTTIDHQTIFSTVIDSVFIGSNALSVIEQVSNKKNLDPELESIYNTSSKKTSMTLILNLKNEKLKPHFFKDSLLNQQTFSNYIMLEVDIAQNQIVMNGITKGTDTLKSLINVFKNTKPQENSIGKVAPNNVDYLVSFTYNNFITLNDNLQKFSKKDSPITSAIFNNSIECGIFQSELNQAVVLKSIDATLTQEALESQEVVDSYRDVSIYNYKYPEIFQHVVSPLIHYQTASYYMVLDDFFVFSDSMDFLKSIISNFQNKTTLSESSYFKNMMTDLSDASSIFIYHNASSLNSTLNTNFSELLSLKLDAYKASAIQFIYDTDYAHVNAAFKTFKSRGVANSVSDEFDISFESTLLTEPQIVTNHTNNQKDIVVQDINNNLYLISNQGKVFWKKKLEGKVLGQIEQMDIYKNGRLQLVFATPHRVYVLDRNGKDVGPFPLRFNDEITQPLSLFDYDNNKNYRLLVTQGSSLLMYDRNGKSVNGFNFNKGSNKISSQPKHFRIGKKDFIVFPQGNTLKILDRTGKTRINVKDQIQFSKNGIYLYNDDFITTNENGVLVLVNQKGQLSSLNLNLNNDHYITSTSKTLVTLTENKLNIKSRSVELDYGDYTAPQIFYINDKIYVTTTDLQAKKIYLFDSLGKPIANFPIYGNSAIALGNIDKDNNLEVITKGDDQSIIVYEIN